MSVIHAEWKMDMLMCVVRGLCCLWISYMALEGGDEEACRQEEWQYTTALETECEH